MNSNNPPSGATPIDRPSVRTTLLRMILTAACGAGLTLVAWVGLVMLLYQRFRGFEEIVWSGTLWFSAMLCTGIVAYSRHSVHPVLACTIAFGLFGLTYMACEGPIFGNASEGGDPSMTQFVVWNLVYLPFGVFAATELGCWLGRRHRPTKADEPAVADADRVVS